MRRPTLRHLSLLAVIVGVAYFNRLAKGSEYGRSFR